MNAVIPSEEQVVEWITSLSNWGRWGDEDQAGCLNLITPEKRQQAAALIRDGATVSCARPITTEITPDITYQVQRYMVDSGEGRDTDPPERRRVRRGAAEFIGMVFHGQTITHIDALSHWRVTSASTLHLCCAWDPCACAVSPAHPLIRSPCSKKHHRRQMP